MKELNMSISLPSRNNLSYLKWCYNSIRKNLGYRYEILLADDFSDDGTWEWMQEIKDKDINVKIYRNEGPERRGIVYWYDYLCEQATNDIIFFLHADMYVCPNLDDEIFKYIEPGIVVSATRIEPPLHPGGPEKIVLDCGIEPEEFDESKLFEFINTTDKNKKPSEGVFAPWAIYKKDYWAVGGHDKLFAPQSKEDSDIFNRLQLNGVKFLQTWQGFVYHMTSRGSRFNPASGGAPGKDSPEWIETTTKNMRNFIRKWGHIVKHDPMMKPTIPPKYDIGFVVKNCDYNHMKELEPWCSTLYSEYTGVISSYILHEQPNTIIDLSEKLKHEYHSEFTNDIVVYFDATKLTNENFQVIINLSDILKESGQTGQMELDIFKFDIKALTTYEKDLILAK